MTSAPNSIAFCQELVHQHEKLLDFAVPSLQVFLAAEIHETDLCFSEAIKCSLESAWECEDHMNGVHAALDEWLDAVRDRLDSLLGPSTTFPWTQVGVSNEEQAGLFFAVDLIRLNLNEEALAKLVAAASRPCEPDSLTGSQTE